MNKNLIAIAGIILVCSCGNKDADKQQLRFVEATTPVEINDSTSKTFSGIAKEAQQINLAFKIAGQIKQIHVSEGQKVKEGQLLASLDDADYKLEKDAIEIQYKQVSDEVARTKQLYEQKSVSRNDYEKAVAGLQQLAIQLQGYKNKLDYTRLYAPTDGYIQNVNFDVDEMVNAGTNVFGLINDSHLEIELDIPASVKMTDMSATRYYCRSAFTEGEIPVRLLSIVPKADGNQLYRARFTMPKVNGKEITAGMNVEVIFKSARKDKDSMMEIPVSSVMNDDNGCYVWQIMPDSTLSRRDVEIGSIDSKGMTRVISGLEGDETIVKSGGSALQANEKVRILPEPSETNIGGLL